jgi:integrase
VSADAIGLDSPFSNDSATEQGDFSLAPEEIAKGERAATAYLDSLKPGDTQRIAEEALDTLAAVISGGVCGARTFPWHQVRAYHGALALSIVKERGAPARVEALRCRHDETRKYQQVPEAYSAKLVQKMRTGLRKVIAEAAELGFLSDDDVMSAMPPTKSGPRKSARERTLTESEVRALVAACAMDESIHGCRDALMISLAYVGGLKTIDLMNIGLDDLHFDHKTGRVTVRVKQAGAKRARRVPLENDALIALEDWLEARGRDAGPLFCPIVRGPRIELKRLTAADVRELCDLRAEQAGVLAFAANDLARSSPVNNAGGRRKRSRTQLAESQPTSILFDAGRGDEEPTEERIHFPYKEAVGG